MTDLELLHEYSARNSEEAFETLANRYTNLVFSAALRQTGNHASAQEITQAVFIILARKAAHFPANTILSGWLLRTAHFVALNARRRELHRRDLEQQAMSLYTSETEAAWKGIAPLLDEALVSLSERDRNAVALRFFEQKSFKEIAQLVGTTEDSAQKRVARALEKLRSRFVKRGITLSATLLAGAIHARAVQAAPAGLAKAACSAAVGGSAGLGVVSRLADCTLARWAGTRLRNLTFQGASVVALAGLVWLATHRPIRNGNGAKAPPAVAALEGKIGLKMGANNDADKSDTRPANPEGLRFRVADSESQALVANARLTAIWTPDSLIHITNSAATDAEGMALLALERTPVRDWGICVEVYRDGYVPKYVSWSEQQGDNPEDVPATYMTKLTPAVYIGGLVVDEAGERVPDARVVFDVPKSAAPAEGMERERLTMTSRYHVETTDSQGRWHCSHVPQQFGVINFEVAHPAYAPIRFGSASLGATTNHAVLYLAQDDLRKEAAVMRIRHGALAGGVVVDESGNPVAAAKVTFNQQWSEPTASQLTDLDGRFRFTNIPVNTQPLSEKMICLFTVQAEGYSPADFRFSGAVPPAESHLSLVRGALLRGRVVDESGKPVPKATVQICSHSNVKRFEWSAATDAEGKFEWPSAPPKPEFYVVQAAGYQPLPEVEWTADGTEHQVTLHSNPPAVRIFGSALDAATGKAIAHFQVWMSFTENAQTGYGLPMASLRPSRLRASGSFGQFAFTNHDAVVEYTLEARAEGYCPAQLNGRGPLTNDSRFDFQLEPTSPLSGEVRLPDGTRVTDAMVMLVAGRNGAYMKLPGQFDLALSGARHTETDAQGRFSFPPTAGATNILAFSPAGFAAVTPSGLAASPIVTLQPWGRVEGLLKIGSQPGANELVDLTYMPLFAERNGCSVYLECKTDAEGKFALEGVPPWPLQIAHRLSFRDGKKGWIPQSQSRQIQVQAGQTTFVELGGTGWKVMGKLRLSSNLPEREADWRWDVQTFTTKPPGRSLAPEPAEFASSGEFQTAWTQWVDDQRGFWQSEAGREAYRTRRVYVLVFEKDGSFRIDDVAPGIYELKVRLSDLAKPPLGAGPLYPTLGTLTKEIAIPELTTNQGAGTYDLGLLYLK